MLYQNFSQRFKILFRNIRFNISIKDLIFSIKNKSEDAKNGDLDLKDAFKNLKKSALDMITDEVDDTTMVEEKTGFFKKLMNKKK